MKKNTIFLIVLLLHTAIAAVAGNNTWIGGAAGSWATNGNWSTGAQPVAADVVIFNNGLTVTVSNVPTKTITGLTVQGNTNVTLQPAGGNKTITIDGGGAADLNIALGSTLNLDGATIGKQMNIVFSAAAANTATIAGTITTSNQPDKLAFGNCTATISGLVTNNGTFDVSTGALTGIVNLSGTLNNLGTFNNDVAGGTMNISGTFNSNGNGSASTNGGITNITGSVYDNGKFKATGGTVNVNNGGVIYDTAVIGGSGFVFNNGSMYDAIGDNADFPPTTATWNVGSTCEITGNKTATVVNNEGGTFYNVIWNCPGQTSAAALSATFTTVNGNLSIVSTGTGSISFSGGGATLNVGGDFTQSGGTISSWTGAGARIVNVSGNCILSGGSVTMVTGANGTTVFNVIGSCMVSGTSLTTSSTKGVYTFNVTGAFLISNGTITCGATTTTGGYIFNLSGDYTQNGGTITVGANAGTFNFNKAGTQNFTIGGGSVIGKVNYTVNSGLYSKHGK